MKKEQPLSAIAASKILHVKQSDLGKVIAYKQSQFPECDSGS